jgi:CheY-like chemotaxis protein
MATILVVDDDIAVQGMLCEALEGAGYRTVVANDGRDAIRVYAAEQPDVVITDVFMPRASGIDLVHALNALERRPRMIVISGVAGEQFLQAAREVNVEHTFTKPFDVREVVRAVAELVGRRAP